MTKHTDIPATPATPWTTSDHTLAENLAEAQRLAAWLNDHKPEIKMDKGMTAQEFADKYGHDLTRLSKISNSILGLMTAYGDYRFAHGERVGYTHAETKGRQQELRIELLTTMLRTLLEWGYPRGM